MEYHKIIDFLNNTPNQYLNLRQKIETYNKDNQIRFKTSVLWSSLCDYNDAYILVKIIITVALATAEVPNNANNKAILKNYAPFINFITIINNTQVDNAHGIDVVMSTYNLIEYSDNYLKISGVLWQYLKDNRL